MAVPAVPRAVVAVNDDVPAVRAGDPGGRSMSRPSNVVGKAPNVDLRGQTGPEILEGRRSDEHRVVNVTCLTCGLEDQLLMEPGRTHPWSHDARNASHMVEYHEVGR
jgi:hypothetical protein